MINTIYLDKKIVYYVAILLICASLLVACSSDYDQDAPENYSQEAHESEYCRTGDSHNYVPSFIYEPIVEQP